jgi:hypothetical protein
VECIKCGHVNGDERESCENCNLYLPGLEKGEDGLAHPVYDRYLVFRNAVRELLDGRWSVDDFKRFLDDQSFKMAQKEQEIRELEIPPDALEDFREELEIGFEGIDLYNKALVHFRQYVSTLDNAYARSGLELAWAGNEKINEARLVNRKSRGEAYSEGAGGEESEAAAASEPQS